MTSLTEPALRWSPDATEDDATLRASRLLLSCLAATFGALAAVAAVTSSGGRLVVAVGLDLVVALALCGAIVAVARADRDARAAQPAVGLHDPEPVAPARERTSDSALVPAGYRTGESFFDTPRAEIAPGWRPVSCR